MASTVSTSTLWGGGDRPRAAFSGSRQHRRLHAGAVEHGGGGLGGQRAGDMGVWGSSPASWASGSSKERCGRPQPLEGLARAQELLAGTEPGSASGAVRMASLQPFWWLKP